MPDIKSDGKYYRAKLLLLALTCASLSSTSVAEKVSKVQSDLLIDGGTILDNKTRLRWHRCSANQEWIEGNHCDRPAAKLGFYEAHALVQHEPGGMPRLPTAFEFEQFIKKAQQNGLTLHRLLPTVNAANRYFWVSAGPEEGPRQYVDLLHMKVFEFNAVGPLASDKLNLLWVRDEDEWCAY